MRSWLPTREDLIRYRWLRPVAHHLEDEQLWQMTRDSVARAVAIGVFFGLLVPIAQVLLAVPLAIFLRANVAIAAASTLITNPFTFPVVYWCAHLLGMRILGSSGPAPVATEVVQEVEQAVGQPTWIAVTWDWLLGAGAPLAVGLTVLSVAGAVVGYLAVSLLWREKALKGTADD